MLVLLVTSIHLNPLVADQLSLISSTFFHFLPILPLPLLLFNCISQFFPVRILSLKSWQDWRLTVSSCEVLFQTPRRTNQYSINPRDYSQQSHLFVQFMRLLSHFIGVFYICRINPESIWPSHSPIFVRVVSSTTSGIDGIAYENYQRLLTV